MDNAPTETRPLASRRGRGRSLRARVAAASLVSWALGLLLSVGSVHATFATFSAETENSSSAFAGGWIPAPSGLSAAVGGSANDEAALTWTSGASAASPSPNPVTDQTLMYADGGSGASASCGSYSSAGTVGAATTTDSVGETPAADWWCLRMVSDSATTWTTSADFTPIRLLVPISVTLAEAGGHPGGIENGDTLTITYNQDVKTSGTTIAIRACKSQGTVVIGATCGGSPSVGEISGMTVAANSAFTSSTWVIAGPTIVFTLAGGSGHTAVSGGGPFVGSGNKIKAVAGNTLVCGGSNCQPSSSGSF